MKQLLSISILVLFMTNFSAFGQTKLKRYDVKSGEVKYEITTSGKVLGSIVSGNGTENLYFKDWGAIELLEEQSSQTTQTNIFGIKKDKTTKTHVISKLDNGERYHVDFDKKSIFMSRDLAMDMTKSYQKDGDASVVGRNMLESMGGKIIGHEIFLGYNCELWDINGGKQWMYKGVVLKLEMTILGITTIKKATSAVFNKNVADKFFQLPDFPVQKEAGFLNNEEYNEDMNDVNENKEKLKGMSFEEWKKIALSNKEDKEMQNMSDAELHRTYDMLQLILNK